MAIGRNRRMTASGAAAAERSRRTAGAAFVLVLWALAVSAPAAAAPDWRRGLEAQLEPHSLVDNPPGISLEQAANKVRRETGGRVLSASPSDRDGQRGYEIRVLLDGKRVKSYFVDGQGRMRARD